MLKFRVEGQKLTWENPDEVVVAGTKKYLECYFEFDGDAWSGFENIEVFFKNGRDKPVRMLLSANRIWKEDRLCLSAGDWSVYLRAMVSKKKLDEEGNVIYEEDGVTPVMELDKQITSSTVSIRVLAHGQFENAQNSFESPEIAEQYIAQMLDIGNAMSVFEEYNPEKEYVKHNKVTFEGSSYVLMSERAQGVNPTDDGVWLLITERGKNGEKGTTIHTVNFGLSKVNPVGVRYSNYWRGEGMYLDFTMPKGFVEGDLLFDGGSGLMFNHSTARYSTTEHGETIMVTYDVITVIANLNGKDAVVDQELDWDSENAIANKTVAMKVNEIRSVMSAIEGTSARTDFSNVSNEDFRAKAEEAGVGGDAGLADEKNYMVFKGVVDALPNTANEGEVYGIVVGSTVIKGSQIATNENLSGTLNIASSFVSGYSQGYNFLTEIIQFLEANPTSRALVLVDDETGDEFTINVTSYEEMPAPSGMMIYIYGETFCEDNHNFSKCTFYEGKTVTQVNSYLFYNGEWVSFKGV